MTSAIITLFVIDSHDNIYPGPSTIYVSDCNANRTDAEIAAQQKIVDVEMRHNLPFPF